MHLLANLDIQYLNVRVLICLNFNIFDWSFQNFEITKCHPGCGGS
jgi:hypothetical protein